MADAALLPPGTRLCGADEIAEGAGRVVPIGPGWPVPEVIVVRRGAAFVGYRNHCPHMSVPLYLLDRVAMTPEVDALVCDHHYATFRIADGYCTEGPCLGDSLERVALVVRDGAVVIA